MSAKGVQVGELHLKAQKEKKQQKTKANKEVQRTAKRARPIDDFGDARKSKKMRSLSDYAFRPLLKSQQNVLQCAVIIGGRAYSLVSD